MQLFYQRFSVQEHLLFSLLGITSLVLIGNIIGQNIAENVINWSGIILCAFVMVLSFFMVSKYGIKGNHGKAWILFMLFSAYWFCAETVDVLYDLVLGMDSWEYADDFFYITGYQLFFASLIFYLKPFTKQISKKLVLVITIGSIFLLIPSLIMIIDSQSNISNQNMLVLFSYPILDSIILIPALIGIILFFKGGVNFMMSLLGLGIIAQVVGDNSILFLSLQNIYYPGHLVEVLFLWTYIMFAFGISNHIGLFRVDLTCSSCSVCGKTCSGHN
ncbi:MAG: hypothetical protein OEQ12_05720 [Nitrosopumilus sp.]|nr:hypothetical protein [Nitrosopumilus sp.]